MNIALLKRIAPWLGLLLAAALLYDGYIFYSRWSEKRDVERQRAEHESAMAKKTLSMLGGGGLKINSFYATPGAVRKGSPANICYGVMGAKTLRIDPPVEQVWPALNHCLQVRPEKNTEYKLIAEDSAGHSVTESFVLQVVQ
ncbi:MAG: hypothetical protein QOJ99_6103 [Bryobacterales bacterium]|jgi:hypothetical protein|nr:hypothetical protein [Bryobacterales bacterium]